jgi:nitrogenase molybdenum-iron protein beta chain
MARFIDQPRYKCALAAMQTVQAIPGAIPILHSGPGCAQKLNSNAGTSGKFSPNIFPCTSISEREVVFGGNEKLRSTVENALKIIDAELYVILTGCTSEIVGDDVEEVARSFADADKPVIYANTPGFKGSNYEGHDWILSAIFEDYLPDVAVGAVQAGLVNIFAGPPQQDPFWYGNLRELERLVAQLGLTPNTIFGHGRGLANIDKIPTAQFNLLVSPWVGLESVKVLERKFSTPYLHYPVLPIGAYETTKFLQAVADFAGVDAAVTQAVVDANEAEYYYFIERYADLFLETRIVSKRFVVVSDAQYTLALTKFFVNDLGFFPTTQFIADNTPLEYQDAITEEFKSLNYGIQAQVEFIVDGHEIQKRIRAEDFNGTPLIIGSSWEKDIALELGAHYLNISSPMIERVVVNSSVVGYNGGLKIVEDLYTEALSALSI